MEGPRGWEESEISTDEESSEESTEEKSSDEEELYFKI